MSSQPLTVFQVFSPGLYSPYTYVDRHTDKDVHAILRLLQVPGYLISVVGSTKMGKTVLLKRAAPEAFYIDGSWIETVQDFWIRLASQLDIPTNTSGKKTTGDTASWGFKTKLKALIVDAGATVEGSRSKQIEDGWQSEIPADQAVSIAIGALAECNQNPVIVIDDFHFIPPAVRASVVASLKGLCNSGATCVLVTLPHHRNDAVSQVQDMIGRSRTAAMHEWSVANLVEIAQAGFKALNLLDPDDAIATKLAVESYGSPHLMQMLCLTVVNETNDIFHELSEPFLLQHPEDWDYFFRYHLDTKADEWLGQFVRGPQTRGNSRTLFHHIDGRVLDGYQLIFESLKMQGPLLSTDCMSLKANILSVLDDNSAENFAKVRMTTKLLQITELASNSLSSHHAITVENEDDEIIPIEIMESGQSGKHQPLFEYVSVRGGEVHILEPYLAYSLKWGSDDLLESVE